MSEIFNHLPNLGCHLNDMREGFKICGDQDGLRNLDADESPFLFDVLCDFGENMPEDCNDALVLATKLAREYAGVDRVQNGDRFERKGKTYNIFEIRDGDAFCNYEGLRDGLWVRFQIRDLRDVVRMI